MDYAEVYEKNYKTIFQFFNRRVGFEDAQDLTHDVFTKFLSSWQRYDGVDNYKALLLTQAKWWFWQQRQLKTEPIEDDIPITIDFLAHPRFSINARTVKRCIERLKPKQKEAFLMHLNGLELHQIAAVTGLGISGAHYRVDAARTRFNKNYWKQCEALAAQHFN
jgi:RNA polymerase sigma factor (sigma-70 family)